MPRFRPMLVALVLGAGFVVPAAVVSPASAAWLQPEPRSAGSVDLRPRWEKGQELRYRMELNIDGKARIPGMDGEQAQTSVQDIGLLLRVRDIAPDGGATLEVVYESLKFSMKSDAMDVRFDSSTPAQADNPYDAFLRPIVGVTLTVAMDKDGNITSVSGGEGLASGPAAQFAGQFTSADVVRNFFGPIMTVRKGSGRANVGDTWVNQSTMGGPLGRFNTSITHTLASHRGGRAQIDLRGTTTLDGSAGNPAGIPSIAITDSSLTGKAMWNTETGQLESMETRQQLNVRQGEGDAAMTYSQTMQMKVSLRR